MTLKINHTFVSPNPQGGVASRVYGPQWNADHAIAGTADAGQLNPNVVQGVINDAGFSNDSKITGERIA